MHRWLTRSATPRSAALLGDFLDWYRGIAEHKLAGLTREDATRVSTPTGVTLLGLVQHLAWCEQCWFPYHLLGVVPEPVDIDVSFSIGPDDTIDSVVAGYHEECARARTITDEQPLGAVTAIPHDVFGAVSLRWILVHMIEETARHCGHLDILRELTDGRTGN